MVHLQELTNESRQDIDEVIDIEKRKKDIESLRKRAKYSKDKLTASRFNKAAKIIEELVNIVQLLQESQQKYEHDARKYQYLLLETLDYANRLARTLEERDKAFSLRDVFLPVQLILGYLHEGMDVSVEKEQLAVHLKNIIASPVPEPESEPDPIIRDSREKSAAVWDSLEDAESVAKTEWDKLKEIMHPPIYSRQLIEKLTVLLNGSECSEDAIKAALESCGILVRYYEESDEEMKCYFAKREHGLPYPGLFVLGHDGKLRNQRGGTYID